MTTQVIVLLAVHRETDRPLKSMSNIVSTNISSRHLNAKADLMKADLFNYLRTKGYTPAMVKVQQRTITF